MRRYLLCLVLTMSTACGGGDSSTPTAPTPSTVNIAGNWSGTFTFTPITGGQRTVSAVTATFTQASQNVTGQINFQDTSRMTLSGVISTSTLTASVQFNLASAPQCAGTASISGTTSTSQVRFTVPSLSSPPGCTFFTNGEFVLSR